MRAVISIVKGFRAGVVLKQMHMRWLAMRRCARKRASSPLSNLRSSWMASTHWNNVARSLAKCCARCLASCSPKGWFWKHGPEAEYGASRNELYGSATVGEVADATVDCFLRSVPAALPAIAFLSGGQPAELATARLNEMNVRFKARLPWALAFSFAPRHPAASLGDLARPRSQRRAGAASFVSSCTLQPGRAPGEYSPAMETVRAGAKIDHVTPR